jgi:quercetin dioxygenase-like cupin family protein
LKRIAALIHNRRCITGGPVLAIPEQPRRSFLFALGGLGMSGALPPALGQDSPAPGKGYVLGPNEGEHLIHFRDGGNVFIKAGSATGSNNLALGTQQVTAGAGVPVHRHPQADECFYVLEGSGAVTLNDVRHSFEKGATIFIPRNTWHGFENPDHELLFLWIMTPPGLDAFFRETCSPPGAPPKGLTREQIRAVALKYGTEFR